MKEVRIDGKRYNINTAEFIASWDNDLPYMDFGYLKETLYRKRTGEFFLYGEGGARTKYGRVDDDGRTYIGSENIIPLTDAEARTWLMTLLED